jgi:hypothetical protein
VVVLGLGLGFEAVEVVFVCGEGSNGIVGLITGLVLGIKHSLASLTYVLIELKLPNYLSSIHANQTPVQLGSTTSNRADKA